METTTEAKVDKDLANKKITVTKHFQANPESVWRAWTTRDILDQWWAPKPWRAETKDLQFKEGGTWLYSMVGPKDERHYAKFEYEKINAPKSFEGRDAFSDENGVENTGMPETYWKTEFKPAANGTDVIVTITSKTNGGLEKMLETGFEEGFKMGLGNLEEYLDRK